jgi:hypothetical protein
MDKKYVVMLVVPLVIVSVITLIINWIFPLDGFFINLSTEIIGIILTVVYVDLIIRRHEKMKWKNVNQRVSEQLIIMVNSVLSSIRDACKYSIEDVAGHDALYKLSRMNINNMTLELIKGTEKVIEPNLQNKIKNFDQTTWNTLTTNIGNIHNACINYVSMFANIMNPRQYELVLDLQNQSFKVYENFRCFEDIILESDEDIIKKYGDDEKIELKNELINSSWRDLLKLIKCAKELGNYQINKV